MNGNAVYSGNSTSGHFSGLEIVPLLSFVLAMASEHELTLPLGIGVYTDVRHRSSYSGSPLPRILASLSESVFGGEGLGERGDALCRNRIKRFRGP